MMKYFFLIFIFLFVAKISLADHNYVFCLSSGGSVYYNKNHSGNENSTCSYDKEINFYEFIQKDKEFIISKEFDKYINSFNGRIGIGYVQSKNKIIIDKIFPDSPAALGNLKINDEIISVNNINLSGITDLRVIRGLFAGNEFENINLEIKRNNNLLNYSIIRDPFESPKACNLNMGKDEIENFLKIYFDKGDYENSFNCSLIGNKKNKDAKIFLDWIGYHYEYGYGINKNLFESVKFYEKSANMGSTWSAAKLGFLYGAESPIKEIMNLEKAYKYNKQAHESGNTVATNNLAFNYFRGEFVKQNFDKSFELFKYAYDNGNQGAGCNLAYHYQKGFGIKKNIAKAIELYEEGIKLEDIYESDKVFCHNSLGYLYLNGIGLDINESKALELYKYGVDKNNNTSISTSAWIYANASQIELNYNESIRLYKLAASNGDGYSYGNLGWHYETGTGVSKNLKKAIEYYILGENLGNQYSIDRIKEIQSKDNESSEIAKIFKKIKNIFDYETKEKNSKKENKNTIKENKFESIDTEVSSNNSSIEIEPIESEYKILKKTSVRSSPNSDSQRVKMFNKDQIIYVPGKVINSNWYLVEDEVGVKIGYIFGNSIEVISQNNIVKNNNSLNNDYNINWGNFYALVIGNNKYEYLETLETAVLDARVLSDTLENKYGFNVQRLENASREDIYEKLIEYRSEITDNDYLLIYYAGHGEQDLLSKEGYWQPIDAKFKKPHTWISNSEILSQLRAIKAKHIIVIADSCFSGAMLNTRSDNLNLDNIPLNSLELEKFYKKKNKKIARVAITSGNLEPVPDSIKGSKHSPFAKSLIDILNDNENLMLSNNLFVQLERYLTKYSNFQEPLYGNMDIPEHSYGGHFIFRPIN